MQARRIRISFSDPDATDSDSGDDASSGAGTPGSTKQQATGKTEIVILVGSNAAKNLAAGRGSKTRSSAGSQPAASGKMRGMVKAERRFRGVYERQPGRWAAEFRSHRLKVRHWLGTFPTEDQAKAAYDAFEGRFLAQPDGAVLPLPAPERAGGDGRDVHRPATLPVTADEKRQVVLALMSSATTTMTAAMESSATAREESAVSSTPCVSSFTTSSPSPSASQKAQLLQDVPASFDRFWEEEPTEEDLIGLADLSNLPLPFLDGDMDHVLSLGDLSLFDAGFV